MKTNLIKDESFQFALLIIEVYKELVSKNEFVISKQLFRSGTSIGANIAEAQGGISKREFRNKLSISLKEALETRYWISLLDQSKLIVITLDHVSSKLNSIINILYKIIKTTSNNLKQNR